MTLQDLPTFNASLNATSALLLSLGYLAIRRGNVPAHRACMMGAFGTSSVFLASYLYYHAHVGSVPFQGQGWIRPLYFSLLLVHTILAAVVVPLILRTLFLAWQGRFETHKKWARWTFPIWMTVSVTGVLVYGMLYRL